MNGRPKSGAEPELQVWCGDFGLPAFFPDSLRLIMHLKLSDKPFKLIERHNPIGTKNMDLPYFKHGNLELSDYNKILYHLNKHFPIDSNLNAEEQSLSYAYSNHTESVLGPCFQYARWVDEKNYDESVRSQFAKGITIPFNFYYPGEYRKRAQKEIEAVYGDHLKENELYMKVYKTAENFFMELSDRLGRNEYFLGNKPSSIDTVLFSYLGPILKFPLTNPTITNYLKSHSNLVRYVQRITGTYFSETEKKYIDSQEKKRLTQHKTELQKKNSYNIQNKVFAFLIAAFAMISFARSNGLLGRSSSDDGGDYDFTDSDDDYRL